MTAPETLAREAVALARLIRENVKDASGHEHDDKGLFTGPGAAGGQFAAATSAMKAAHPFPPPREMKPLYVAHPDDPSGVRRILDPEEDAAQRAHNAAYHKAYLANAVHRMLNEKPDKLVALPEEGAPEKARRARAVKAVEQVKDAAEELGTLVAERYHSDVAGAHPRGGQALDAARLEARRRYEAALENAEKHVAELPAETRTKAAKALDAAKLGA